MKFCVYGAGAIGGYLAVELALAGHEVCVVARGAHLKAIQESGLKLLIQGREKTVRLAAEDDPTSFGPQDFVICALKAHQAYDSAHTLAPLLGPTTAVLTATNGIPWWYFYKAGTHYDGRQLNSVDPGARLWTGRQQSRASGSAGEQEYKQRVRAG